MDNHFYTLSISRTTKDKNSRLLLSLPFRYWKGFAQCALTDGQNGNDRVQPHCGSLGTHSIGFRFDSKNANAFRKWIQRRYGYRATFRRAVTIKQNWVQGMLFDPQRLAQL